MGRPGNVGSATVTAGTGTGGLSVRIALFKRLVPGLLAVIAAGAVPAIAQDAGGPPGGDAPGLTPLSPLPAGLAEDAPERTPQDVDPPYPAFVQTTAADPAWVLCTSDLILTTQSCMVSWYDTPFNPCYTLNRYWKFSPGAVGAAAAPMNALGVGSFDGLFVRAP